MKHTTRTGADSREGVALVLVLGLLAIITVLAVAFAISMRVERLAARNFADNVRAEQLIQVALSRAMEDVSDSMINHNPAIGTPRKTLVYPDWRDRNPGGQVREAMASSGPTKVGERQMFNKDARIEATKAIPEGESGIGGLWQDAVEADKVCGWIDVQMVTNAQGTVVPSGRVAYLAVNTSGLLDANLVGGSNRLYSSSVKELNISVLPELGDATSADRFLNNRTNNARYETVTELAALNMLPQEDNFKQYPKYLFTYSYDPGRDVYVMTNSDGEWENLGTPDVVLSNKFNINGITNYTPADYASTKFKTEYFEPLKRLLLETGVNWATKNDVDKVADIAWNIINWIDADRIPQGGKTDPSLHSEGGEAAPLVNEIALTGGVFTVEVWWPYVGVKCGNNYTIKIETQNPPTDTGEVPISDMVYGSNTEFRLFRTEKVGTSVTNAGPPKTTNWVYDAKLGIRTTVFLASPYVAVDRTLNRDGSDGHLFSPAGFFASLQPGESRQVVDPRSNGKLASGDNDIKAEPYWKPAPMTLGTNNHASVCDPWMANPQGRRQGLPIYVKNGPMRNIGELGYIFLSNRENADPALPEVKWFWNTIDLMSFKEGAFLVDRATTRATNVSTRGLISISTQQDRGGAGVLSTLFDGMTVGYDDPDKSAGKWDVRDDDIVAVVKAIQAQSGSRTFVEFRDIFRNDDPATGEPVAASFWRCGEGAAALQNARPNDKVREDTFRNIIEMMTFRQNIITMVLAAQALAPDGKTVVAEKRALATVYRDAYTGAYFTRSFKWLAD